MQVNLLNLISSPMAVLNTLGLKLQVGLSSEDPIVGRHPSEPYDAFLSIYSPEGLFLQREHLGQIPTERRRMFDVSGLTNKLVAGLDHLAVVHQVPSRLLDRSSSVEDHIEMETVPDYSYFRTLVQYSYPSAGNGSLIYDTPHQLNANATNTGSSNSLTFTCQTVLSETVSTFVVLIH